MWHLLQQVQSPVQHTQQQLLHQSIQQTPNALQGVQQGPATVPGSPMPIADMPFDLSGMFNVAAATTQPQDSLVAAYLMEHMGNTAQAFAGNVLHQQQLQVDPRQPVPPQQHTGATMQHLDFDPLLESSAVLKED